MTAGQKVALTGVAVGQADWDVDGNHSGIQNCGQIAERFKYMRGDAPSLNLLDERNPAGGTTVNSSDIGHEVMICMKGEIDIPDDFDRMGESEIAALFGAGS